MLFLILRQHVQCNIPVLAGLFQREWSQSWQHFNIVWHEFLYLGPIGCVIFSSGGSFVYCSSSVHRVTVLWSEHFMWFVHFFWCLANLFSHVICRYHLLDAAAGPLVILRLLGNIGWLIPWLFVIVDAVNIWGVACTVALNEGYLVSSNRSNKLVHQMYGRRGIYFNRSQRKWRYSRWERWAEKLN